MKTIVVRYKVKPERLVEHLSLIDGVFVALGEAKPGGLSYEVLRLEDGVSFIHTATVASEANPLLALEEFRKFTADIKSRCDEPPVSSVATVVHAYST